MRKRAHSLTPRTAMLCVALFMALPSAAFGYTATDTIRIPSPPAAGALMTFNFTDIPTSATDVRVTVELRGDYDSATEYANVRIDGVAPANDRINPIGRQCNRSGVGSSASNRRTFTVGSAVTNDAGPDYLRIRLDATNLLTEGTAGEANNDDYHSFQLAKPTQPDLIVGATSAPVGTPYVAAGNQVTMDYTVTNQGSLLTPSFEVRLYHCRSLSQLYCTLGTARTVTDDFAPGEQRSYNDTFTLPTGLASGSDYVFGGKSQLHPYLHSAPRGDRRLPLHPHVRR